MLQPAGQALTGAHIYVVFARTPGACRPYPCELIYYLFIYLFIIVRCCPLLSVVVRCCCPLCVARGSTGKQR